MIQISDNFTKRIKKNLRRLYQEYSIPRWIVFTLDNLAVFVVFLVAYLLRFNFVLTDFSVDRALHQALIAVSIYALSFLLFRSYSGLIRHTTVMDMLTVFLSTSSSFILLLLISLVSRRILWNEILIIPLSILIIHYVSITVLLFFVRIGIKIIYYFMTSSFSQKKRVLIFGAGEMGVIVKRVIQSDIKCNFHIAGFLDDNRRLQGKKLNGIPVFNPNLLTESFVQKNNIDALIFAIKEISPGRKSSMLHLALDFGLEVLETPSIDTWLNGQFHAYQIQKVKLEDLLGRDPIILNIKGIGSGLAGKTILVTGAAGSIGSEIVRQLTRFNVRKLILIDQAETPMFHLGNELKSKYSHCNVEMILADITQQDIIEGIFQNHHPDLVFHAAAYKHVPLMEENPHEAIRINVGGTNLMTMLSIKYGVKKFVMISTDKAVNPTNVMGVSKRICEMIVQLKAKKAGNTTQFIVTRFGNVLGSNGSVIPIFSRQIEEGGPVTVTHPDITRYFMTIPEACQLVLEAGFMGKGGEIFVFDMGKPVRITDLANQMIRLSGLAPGKDIKIKYTGLRPGEKLFEELLSDKETTKPTHHPKIMIAQTEKLDKTGMILKIEDLLCSLYSLSKQQVVDYCRDLVLGYKSNNRKYIEKPGIIKIAEAEDETVIDLVRHPSKIIINKSIDKSL